MSLTQIVDGVAIGFGRLKPTDRRALELGAWVLIPALALSLVIKPIWQSYDAVGARLEIERGLLAREQSVLAQTDRFPARLHEAESSLLHEAPRLFAGTDQLAASGALANYVTASAFEHRVFVQGTETRAAEAAGDGVLRLGIEVRAVGDLQGITAWLHALEQGSKLVRVGAVAIAPAERIGGSPVRDDEVLGVVLTAQGYMLENVEPSVPTVRTAGGAR